MTVSSGLKISWQIKKLLENFSVDILLLLLRNFSVYDETILSLSSITVVNFSHLVSEGFCLTRNFLLGIPISAALTQYKNKDIQIMFLEREKTHDYKCDTGWQKQIISKLVHYWKTCNKHTKDKFQERRVLIG